MPELAELSKQVLIDQTPEGLRIQLVDQEGRAMFDPGSAKPNDRRQDPAARRGQDRPAPAQPDHHLRPHQRQFRRHEVARPTGPCPRPAPTPRGQIMQDGGIDPDRVYQVSGKAASDPLFPDDPTLPGNRRIAIVLLREVAGRCRRHWARTATRETLAGRS